MKTKTKMKTRYTSRFDKEILDAILLAIAENGRIEDWFAEEMKMKFNMSPDEFSDWLCKVKVR